LNGNNANWVISELEDLEIKRVVELSGDGLTQREIAFETGISLSSVNRIMKKSKEPKLNKT
jgi:transposase